MPQHSQRASSGSPFPARARIRSFTAALNPVLVLVAAFLRSGSAPAGRGGTRRASLFLRAGPPGPRGLVRGGDGAGGGPLDLFTTDRPSPRRTAPRSPAAAARAPGP